MNFYHKLQDSLAYIKEHNRNLTFRSSPQTLKIKILEDDINNYKDHLTTLYFSLERDKELLNKPLHLFDVVDKTMIYPKNKIIRSIIKACFLYLLLCFLIPHKYLKSLYKPSTTTRKYCISVYIILFFLLL